MNANVQRRLGAAGQHRMEAAFADGKNSGKPWNGLLRPARPASGLSRILEEWSTDKRILERIADIDLKHKPRKDRPLQTYELERLKRIVTEW